MAECRIVATVRAVNLAGGAGRRMREGVIPAHQIGAANSQDCVNSRAALLWAGPVPMSSGSPPSWRSSMRCSVAAAVLGVLALTRINTRRHLRALREIDARAAIGKVVLTVA